MQGESFQHNLARVALHVFYPEVVTGLVRRCYIYVS